MRSTEEGSDDGYDENCAAAFEANPIELTD